jgi:hypothetical protein
MVLTDIVEIEGEQYIVGDVLDATRETINAWECAEDIAKLHFETYPYNGPDKEQVHKQLVETLRPSEDEYLIARSIYQRIMQELKQVWTI